MFKTSVIVYDTTLMSQDDAAHLTAMLSEIDTMARQGKLQYWTSAAKRRRSDLGRKTEPQPGRLTPTAQRIVAHLSATPDEWKSRKTIAEELGIKPSTAGAELFTLARDGHILSRQQPTGSEPTSGSFINTRVPKTYCSRGANSD